MKTKITPYKDVSWYIKWTSTCILLVAITSRAAGGPQLLDFCLSITGTLGWTVVGFMWHDRALMILNSVVAGILTVGVLRVLFA
tara:strand:+ start:480 stop:731 length:252 start_codon:yes stop_codon:yes gene_type:complete